MRARTHTNQNKQHINKEKRHPLKKLSKLVVWLFVRKVWQPLGCPKADHALIQASQHCCGLYQSLSKVEKGTAQGGVLGQAQAWRGCFLRTAYA